MPRALVLMLATLALGLAACGEDDEEKFREAWDPVDERLSELGNDVRDALQEAEGLSDAQIEREFNRLADALAGIGEDVEALDPPSDQEERVTKLGQAIDDTEDALRDIATAARNHDDRGKRTATLDLLQHGERLDAFQKRIDQEVSG